MNKKNNFIQPEMKEENTINIASEKDDFPLYRPENSFLDNSKIFRSKTNINEIEVDYEKLRENLERKK